MGLTGIILSATLKLNPAQTLLQKVEKQNSFKCLYEKVRASSQSAYAYAWLDGFNFEHSLLITGKELSGLPRPYKKNFSLIIPNTPTRFLDNFSVRAFNTLYYATGTKDESEVGLNRAHFPLEIINGWNHLYGKEGMIQVQMVLPETEAFDGYQEIFTLIKEHQQAPYLCSFRKLGVANNNLLSFPLEGFSLALDFKNSPETRALVARIHEIIVRLKGKIYLAKDSLMTSKCFKSIYPEWEKFESIRAQYNALGKFRSAQSLRIGLG
jgi:FAD/FMN-containing dehydrogenase